MIKGFADKETEKLFNLKRSRKLAGNIQQSARRKLESLDAAEVLEELRILLAIALRSFREIEAAR